MRGSRGRIRNEELWKVVEERRGGKVELSKSCGEGRGKKVVERDGIWK